ncbi:MAG: M23 family metallopeptidase [Balneolales bacterium]
MIKKLYQRRKENITLILLEKEEPGNPKSYSFKPYSLFVFLVGFNLMVIILSAAFLFITPVGNFVFDKDDREVRHSVENITTRIMSLQDSLAIRDQQLIEMKKVIAEGTDTVFSVQHLEQLEGFHEESPQFAVMEPSANIQVLDANQIIYSRNLKMAPEFPAEPPISGTVSRLFDSERLHMGVDITASEGATAKVVADGVVINADWTMNYGYVVHIHHGEGYTSTYKHLSNINKRKGDIIFRGDILGTVGKSGVLTSGPHIHFELWRDGIALDPLTFLTNLSEAN